MNRKKQDKFLREVGVKGWDEVFTERQLGAIIKRFYELTINDGASILQQIPYVNVLLNAYFDDLSYTVINYEPLMMYDIIEAKEYISSLFGSSRDYKKIAEACSDFSVWYNLEPTVYVQGHANGSPLTAADAVELIKMSGDQRDGEDKLIMTYDSEITNLRADNDSLMSDMDVDMVVEAMIEQLRLDAESKKNNSKLH